MDATPIPALRTQADNHSEVVRSDKQLEEQIDASPHDSKSRLLERD